MNCDDVDELLPGLALGSHAPEERQELERHLATCERHPHWADFQRVAAMLPLSVDPVTPPREVKQRLMARVYRDVDAHFVGRRGWRLVGGWLAAAAMALLTLGLGVRDVALSGRLASAPVQWQLQPAASDVRSSGTFVWLPSLHIATLAVQQLPALPAGNVYEVWLIKGGTPVAEGVFQAGPDDSASVLVKDEPQGYDTVAVTREPGPAGSQAPTTAPFIAASLR